MKNESGTVESQDTTLNFDFIVSFADGIKQHVYNISLHFVYTLKKVNPILGPASIQN